MRLVRCLGGGALVASGLILVACANGTELIDVGEAGVIDDAAVERDVVTLPPKDSGTGDTTVEKDSGGSCTKKVFINELKTDGPGANDEFVELYNPNDCSVPLGGWSIKYQSASGGAGPNTGHTFATGDSIPAKSFLVLAPATFAGADAPWTPGMAAAAGQIALFDDTNTKIDGVGYGTITGGSYREGTSAPSPPANGSIGRKIDGVDTDNNQADFKTFTTHTAGAAN